MGYESASKVTNCKKHLADNYYGQYTIPKSALKPFTYEYDPDLDTTAPCDPNQASHYMLIIGVLGWIVELGRIDYLSHPREGHLEAAIHVMAYLKQKHNSHLFVDPSYPKIDESTFNNGADWKQF
ncbi:LOW QUALITY PROTEIN: hypothetical protein ACHAXR_003505 [Thalassiosira sp. AJA248-18]